MYPDETARSRARRGLLGHYVAGAWRVLLRPPLTAYHVAWARALAFFWGMEDVTDYVARLPRRYLVAVLRAFGATISPTATLYGGLYLHNTNHQLMRPLIIGDHSVISPQVFIDLCERVTIGARVTLSSHVRILTHLDVGHSPLATRGYPPRCRPVTIGDGVYVGVNATIGDGVTIGEGALVAAHSVVLADVPPYTLVAGAPAVVKKRL